jgi:CshA-type fibril repeat protein
MPTIPPPPTSSNDTSSGAYDTNQTISPLTNDAAGTGATLVPSSLKLCATTTTAITSCTLTSLFVPNEGTYTVNANGTITFDPLPTFTGQASPIKYVIADSTGQVTSALITPTVGLPTAPTVAPQEKVLAPGATVSFTTLTGSGGLASSVAGLNSTVTCLYTPGTTTCDADGVIEIAGEGTYRLDVATGVVTYTADANAAPGTKTAISYQVTDIFGQTSTSTLTPKIPVPPTGTNDTSSGAYDTNQVIALLTNDAAGIGATLVPSSVKLCATTTTDPANCTLTTLTVDGEGTYTVNANGTITFDPLPTFAGQASPVKYVVADSTGQLASATLIPTVSAPVAPSATPQTKFMAPGATISFTTLTGTSGLASTIAPFDTAITCLFTPGTTTCDADGVVYIEGEGTYTLDTATGIVTYKADDNAAPGTKTAITYQVTDIFGKTATSTLTPKIPSPPKGTNDTSSGAYDTNQIISLFTNDSAGIGADLDLTTLRLCPTTSTDPAACTLTTLTVVGEGTYTINPDGTVTFDPLPTFKGSASPVKYVVADSTGQVTSANITVNVVAPPAPKATPEVKRLKPGGTISFSPLIGPKGLASSEIALSSLGLCLITPDSNPATCDEDGVVEFPGVGVYRLNVTTGVVSFTASKDFKPGTKTSVTYQMMDAAGQWVQSTLTPQVDVEEVPVPKVAMPATGATYLGYLVIFAATFIGLGVSLTRKRNTLARR